MSELHHCTYENTRCGTWIIPKPNKASNLLTKSWTEINSASERYKWAGANTSRCCLSAFPGPLFIFRSGMARISFIIDACSHEPVSINKRKWIVLPQKQGARERHIVIWIPLLGINPIPHSTFDCVVAAHPLISLPQDANWSSCVCVVCNTDLRCSCLKIDSNA